MTYHSEPMATVTSVKQRRHDERNVCFVVLTYRLVDLQDTLHTAAAEESL
jgi:hypothetical protein